MTNHCPIAFQPGRHQLKLALTETRNQREMQMSKQCAAALFLVLSCLSGLASAGTIKGEIKQLDGKDMPSVSRFRAVAVVGGQIVGTGRLTTNSAPFKYEIFVNDALLSP